MNSDVNVSFTEGDDSEDARITIRNFGILSELRFRDQKLDAVAHITSADVGRLFEALAEAERKRIDPDNETIKCIEHLMDRFDYVDEEKTRLYLQIELVMPIAACGSIKLEPNLKEHKFGEIPEEDGEDAQSND